MTSIDNKLFTYINHKQDLTPEITKRYENSLIFIGDEQQLYNPLTNTYIGIGLSSYTNTLTYLINEIDYSKDNLNIYETKSTSNNTYYIPFIKDYNKGVYHTYSCNTVGINPLKGAFIGNLIGTADNAEKSKISELSYYSYLTYMNTANGNNTYYLTLSNSNNYSYSYFKNNLKYNPNTETLDSTYFNGKFTGNMWGNLYGNAQTSTKSERSTYSTYISVNNTETNYTYSIVFANGNGDKLIYSNSQLNYNPSTGILKSAKFKGNLEGNADTSTLSNTTDKLNIKTSSSNGTYYIPFVNDTSNSYSYVNTDLYYNPNSKTLTVSKINGLITNASLADSTDKLNLIETNENKTYYIPFVNNKTNSHSYVDGDLNYNPSTNTLTVANLEGISKQSTYIKAESKESNGTYNILFSTSGNGYKLTYLNSNLNYNPSTGILKSAKFEGNLIGNADSATLSNTADKLNIKTSSTNTSYYIQFVNNTSNSYSYVNTNLKYNPSNGTLETAKFKGNLEGNADSATLSNTSDKLNIKTSSTNTSYYIQFVNNTSNSYSYVNTNLKYNPSNGTLETAKFKGNLEGNADSATLSNTSDKLNIKTSSTNTSYYIQFVNNTSNSYSYVNTDLYYNPNTKTLTVSNISGSITNSVLSNSTDKLNLIETNENKTYYLTFVNNKTNSYSYVDSHLNYNPSSNTLTVDNLEGTSRQSTYIKIESKESNNTYNILFSEGTGYKSAYFNSQLKYNAFSGTLESTKFKGNLEGNADTSTLSNTTDKLKLKETSTSGTYYLPFVNNRINSYSYINTDLYYNPNSKTLNVSNINGLITNATLADSTDKLNLIETNENNTYYLTFVNNKTNSYSYVDSHLNYNPSNNTLTVDNLEGTSRQSTYIKVESKESNNTYNILFVTSGNGYKSSYLNSNLNYNPYEGILSSNYYLGQINPVDQWGEI